MRHIINDTLYALFTLPLKVLKPQRVQVLEIIISRLKRELSKLERIRISLKLKYFILLCDLWDPCNAFRLIYGTIFNVFFCMHNGNRKKNRFFTFRSNAMALPWFELIPSVAQ